MISSRYYFKKFWRRYLTGVLALLATTLLSGSIPMQIKWMLDTVQANTGALDLHEFLKPVLWLLGTMSIMFVIRVFSRYAMLGVGYFIEEDVRQKLYTHLLRMPQAFFDKHPSGELMSRLTNDLNALRMFMGGGMMMFFNVIFAYSVMMGLMWTISWQLTLTAFALFPLILSQTLNFGKSYKKRIMASQKQLAHISALASENFMGMPVIHGFGAEKASYDRFEDASLNLRGINLNVARMRVAFMMVVAITTSLNIWVVLSKGGWEVIGGTLTLSSLTAFMLYLERLSWPTVTIGWIFASFNQGRVSIDRINELLTAPVEATLESVQDKNAQQTINFERGRIRIEKLSFNYPEKTQSEVEPRNIKQCILNDVSINIKEGDFVLLVGPVGSGKSTLLQLLAGRYRVKNRTIFFNDAPIETITLHSLRQHVAWMPQSSTLFSMSIYDNLVFSSESHTPESVTAMAEVTTLANDIAGFSEGYKTLVGERGVMLSGGQRQRTALTRTLLTQPDVLLLDDPFASVDEPTEKKIIESLRNRQLLKNRTTIMATHRLVIAPEADSIIVLNTHGEVEAQGTHVELLETSNLYRELNRKEKLEAMGIATTQEAY